MKSYEILVRDTAAEARVKAQENRRKARERAANIQRMVIGFGVSAVAVAIVIVTGCAIMAAGNRPAEISQPEDVAGKVVEALPTAAPVVPVEIDDLQGPLFETVPTAWAAAGGEPLTREQTIEALLTHGYLSDAVPLAYEYQDFMRTYCAEYGCPYPLALAVAEVESNFDMDAVGMVGEIGIMQLSPGPDGAYHAEIEAATGLDPTTPEGNIAGGCYMLGKFLARYGDPATAVMAYRMGQSGADKALAAGADPAEWAAADMAGMERWECTVNAWRGQ